MSKNLIEAIRTKAKWEKVDWANLPSTYKDVGGTWQIDYRYMVERSQILSYVEYIIKDVARNFGCSFSEISKLIKEENTAFFSALDCVFKKTGSIEKDHENLNVVLKLFKVPTTTGFSYTEFTGAAEVTTEQFAAIFTTIIEQMVPKDKQEEFKKYFNI